MSLLTIETITSGIGQGITYLVDPANRIIAIGISITIFLFVIKIIFKRLKILIILAAIIAAIYFAYQFLVNAA